MDNLSKSLQIIPNPFWLVIYTAQCMKNIKTGSFYKHVDPETRSALGKEMGGLALQDQVFEQIAKKKITQEDLHENLISHHRNNLDWSR